VKISDRKIYLLASFHCKKGCSRLRSTHLREMARFRVICDARHAISTKDGAKEDFCEAQNRKGAIARPFP
jgi:hypothetical protein